MIQKLIAAEPLLKTGICIRGTGRALPSRIIPNTEFEQYLDTTDDWIRTRTGILERRFAEPHETTSQYAARAAERALASAGLRAQDIDLILLSTTTPDRRFPSTANMVQGLIGAHKAYAYDITVACSGFIFALASAHAQIQAGLAERALVISAEIYSSIVDFSDRDTCVLFGDGAGAVVLEKTGTIKGEKESGIRYPVSALDTSGIISISLHSESTSSEILTCEGGGTAGRTGRPVCGNGTIRMQGKRVFILAVKSLAERSREVLDRAGITLEEVDCIIPHQANIRIIERLARQLGCSMEKMYTNLHKYGNTSSASIPIALDEAFKSTRIQRGDLVLCAAAGAGFSSGAVLVRL